MFQDGFRHLYLIQEFSAFQQTWYSRYCCLYSAQLLKGKQRVPWRLERGSQALIWVVQVLQASDPSLTRKQAEHVPHILTLSISEPRAGQRAAKYVRSAFF